MQIMYNLTPVLGPLVYQNIYQRTIVNLGGMEAILGELLYLYRVRHEYDVVVPIALSIIVRNSNANLTETDYEVLERILEVLNLALHPWIDSNLLWDKNGQCKWHGYKYSKGVLLLEVEANDDFSI